MHKDQFVFAKLVEFLDQDHFNYLVSKYDGDKYVKSYTFWNQLLTMMLGQRYVPYGWQFPGKNFFVTSIKSARLNIFGMISRVNVYHGFTSRQSIKVGECGGIY